MTSPFSKRTKLELPPSTLDSIRIAANNGFPNEICGFIKPDLSFVEVTNTSETPDKSFIISAVDRIKHKDSIAVVHTHCSTRYLSFDIRTPSEADSENQRKSGLTWLIFGSDGESISETPVQIPRYPNPDYLNRTFITGFTDCYSIIQDYYHFELGISLVEHLPYKIRDIVTGKASFDEYIQYAGFIEIPITELQNHDVVLLDNGIGKRNHVGIYHDNKILHQDELSMEESYEHFIGRINCVLRHKDSL